MRFLSQRDEHKTKSKIELKNHRVVLRNGDIARVVIGRRLFRLDSPVFLRKVSKPSYCVSGIHKRLEFSETPRV